MPGLAARAPCQTGGRAPAVGDTRQLRAKLENLEQVLKVGHSPAPGRREGTGRGPERRGPELFRGLAIRGSWAVLCSPKSPESGCHGAADEVLLVHFSPAGRSSAFNAWAALL